MTNFDQDEASRLVEDFLIEDPHPQIEDWKRLIGMYPKYAKFIADTALAYDAPKDTAIHARALASVIRSLSALSPPIPLPPDWSRYLLDKNVTNQKKSCR